MATAGRSARNEYVRRRAREKETARRNLRFTIPIIAITPVLVYLAVRLGIDLLNLLLRHSIQVASHQSAPRRVQSPIRGSLANGLALLLAFVATVSLAGQFWGRRQTTEAWRLGAEGEERLGAALDELGSHGYHLFHDLALPRSKANVDHLAIGPAGVFVIDSKNFTGKLTWSKNTLWHGRYPLTKKLDAITWEMNQVRRVLGCAEVHIRPVMCVLGASLPSPSMLVNDVRVVEGPARLVKGILDAPTVIDPPTVTLLSGMVRSSLPSHT